MPYDHDYVCMMKELSKSLRQKHGAACIRVVFFGISSTLIDAHTLPGQTEGLKGGFAKVDNVFLRLGGFAKVDKRFGYEKWLQGGCKGWIHLYKRYV